MTKGNNINGICSVSTSCSHRAPHNFVLNRAFAQTNPHLCYTLFPFGTTDIFPLLKLTFIVPHIISLQNNLHPQTNSHLCHTLFPFRTTYILKLILICATHYFPSEQLTSFLSWFCPLEIKVYYY